MYTLDEILEIHGGPLHHGSLRESVEKTFESYKQLSGVNPIFVPNLRPKLETSGPSRFAGFHFVDSWTCNAAVALSTDQPIFICNAGFPFIIYDFISRLLSHPTILRGFEAAEEDYSITKNKFLDKFDYQKFISKDFVDISDDRKREIVRLMFPNLNGNQSGTRDSSVSLSSLTTELADGWRKHLPYRPINHKRRGLVTYITYIINAFLFGHEACHVNNGHLEYLRRQYGVTDLIEFNIGLSSRHSRIDNKFYQAMEYEADLAGFRKTLRYIFEYLPLDRFWEFSFIKDFSIQEKARIWIFALSAFFCLLEWERTKSRGFFSWFSSKNLKHPSNILRLTNIIEHSVSNVSFNDGAGFDLKRFVENYAIDLADITNCLGISESFFNAKNINIKPEQGRDIMDDMRDELEDCVSAIRHMYYVRGKNASEVNIEEEADDPFGLKGQHAEIYHKEEGVTEKRNFDTGIAEFYDKDGNLIRRVKMR